MKKNTLKKMFSALSIAAVAASAVSISAFADADLGPDNGQSAADIKASKYKPVITVSKLLLTKEEAGKEVSVDIMVSEAAGSEELAYCGTGIHLYYSDQLTISKTKSGAAKKTNGECISELGVFSDKVDDSCDAEGMNGWFFSTGGEGDYAYAGTMYTLKFTLPEKLEGGEVFPFDIIYKSNPSAKDAFIDYYETAAGKIMQGYAFTQGIYCPDTNPNFTPEKAHVDACPALANINKTYDGYIAIAGGEEETSTTTTTTTTVETTTTTEEVTTTTTAEVTTTTTGATTTTTSGKGAPVTTSASTSKSTASSSSTKKDDSPKTGVAGVGVAAAGLAVAVATAFVLRKKED